MAIILLGLTDCEEFYFNGSVHREAMSTVVQQDATTCSLLYFCKLLYTFQVVTPPIIRSTFKPLKPELNPICYLLALLGAHHFLHVSRIRVKLLILRLLMSYIYGSPILDVSRSHTTTQHSR